MFLLDLFIIALCNSSVINGASFPLIYFLLINLVPLVFFYNPWKHQKTIIFSISSGRIERHEWYEMFIENAEDCFLETFKIWSTKIKFAGIHTKCFTEHLDFHSPNNFQYSVVVFGRPISLTVNEWICWAQFQNIYWIEKNLIV